MRRLQGCGTALVTPMTAEGTLDEPRLRALVEWQIAEGVHFLVPCGTTGEAATLSPDERRQVVCAVTEVAGGRVKIVAGATSNATELATQEARAMADAGADYILTAAPYYNKPTAEGLYRHFGAVADAAGRPLIVYNVPGRTAVNMDAQLTLRLAATDGIHGIKEASGNLGQMMEILRARPEHFSVLSGDDALTLPLIALGGDGVISVVANETPGLMARLVNLGLTGDLADAQELHYRILPLMNANFIESNPIPVKAALNAMGRIDAGIRLPLVALSDSKRPTLIEALKEAGALA